MGGKPGSSRCRRPKARWRCCATWSSSIRGARFAPRRNTPARSTSRPASSSRKRRRNTTLSWKITRNTSAPPTPDYSPAHRPGRHPAWPGRGLSARQQTEALIQLPQRRDGGIQGAQVRSGEIRAGQPGNQTNQRLVGVSQLWVATFSRASAGRVMSARKRRAGPNRCRASRAIAWPRAARHAAD